MSRPRAFPLPFRIALLGATLLHALLIFGIRPGPPHPGQPARRMITMTLEKSAPAGPPPSLAPAESGEHGRRPVAEPVGARTQDKPDAPPASAARAAEPPVRQPHQETAPAPRETARPRQNRPPDLAHGRRDRHDATPPSAPAEATDSLSSRAETSPRTRPALSAGLLSQQIAEVGADIYQRRSAELRDRKIVHAQAVKNNRLAVAAYEQAWQEKVERIGNLNYPKDVRRDRLAGTLVLAVGIKPDGSVYSTQIQQSSGQAAVDLAARHIVELAAPFAPLPEDIREEVDVLVITRTWRFDSDYRLEMGAR